MSDAGNPATEFGGHHIKSGRSVESRSKKDRRDDLDFHIKDSVQVQHVIAGQ